MPAMATVVVVVAIRQRRRAQDPQAPLNPRCPSLFSPRISSSLPAPLSLDPELPVDVPPRSVWPTSSPNRENTSRRTAVVFLVSSHTRYSLGRTASSASGRALTTAAAAPASIPAGSTFAKTPRVHLPHQGKRPRSFPHSPLDLSPFGQLCGPWPESSPWRARRAL